jgi:hypothetical protein
VSPVRTGTLINARDTLVRAWGAAPVH